jgi:hypothetical protein
VTTAQAAIDEARSLVEGGQVGSVTRLIDPYTPGDSTVTLASTDGLSPGAIFCIGLTTFVVVSASSSEVEVIASADGSPDASQAGSTLARIKPRHSTYAYWLALKAAISEMGAPDSGLYGVGRFEPVIDGDETALAVPDDVTDMVKVLEVRRRPAGGYYENTWDQIQNWELKNRAGGAGSVIRLSTPVSRSDTVEVVYAKSFTPPTSLGDDLQTVVGLSPSMNDIPALLMAARLVLSSEGRRLRLEAQGDGRRPSEVSESASAQASREYRRMAAQRIRNEGLGLLRQHGIRRQG